jgi:hypothetical protein
MGNRTVGELGSACGASASCFFFLGAQARTLSAKSMATLTWQQGPREGRRVETGLAVRQREVRLPSGGRRPSGWAGGGGAGGGPPRTMRLGRGRPPPPWPAAAGAWSSVASRRRGQIVTVPPEVSIMKVANPDIRVAVLTQRTTEGRPSQASGARGQAAIVFNAV